MSWRNDPTQAEPRRRRIARLLDVLVGCQLSWLGLHHLTLVWCVDPFIAGQSQQGFPLPYVRWNGVSSLEYIYSPLPMLFDLLCYGAVLVPVLVLVGRKLGWLWVRALLFAALIPFASLSVFIDLLGWRETEWSPPRGPVHGVYLYLGPGTPPLWDSRCLGD